MCNWREEVELQIGMQERKFSCNLSVLVLNTLFRSKTCSQQFLSISFSKSKEDINLVIKFVKKLSCIHYVYPSAFSIHSMAPVAKSGKLHIVLFFIFIRFGFTEQPYLILVPLLWQGIAVDCVQQKRGSALRMYHSHGIYVHRHYFYGSRNLCFKLVVILVLLTKKMDLLLNKCTYWILHYTRG